MTEQQLHKWIALLPREAPAPPGGRTGGPKSRAAGRPLITWLNDPAFGWNFARFFSESRRAFPFQALSDPIIRAYRHLSGVRDADISLGRSIHEGEDRHTAAVVDSLLLCPNMKMEEIARLAGVPARAIGLYHDLWFNVRDRLQNRAYIAWLVYPQGRLARWQEEGRTFGQALRQVAWEKGSEAALEAAGLRVHGEARDVFDVASDVQLAIMEKGLEHLKRGDEEHATVKLGARIVRRSPVPDAHNDAEMGLTAVSLTCPIVEDLRRLHEEDMERRRQAAIQEAEAGREPGGGDPGAKPDTPGPQAGSAEAPRLRRRARKSGSLEPSFPPPA